jgi:uncharacterized protein with HEPN domain
MRDDAERLRDMLEAIVNIEKYASKGQQSYLTNELIQVWIVHHIQIIGEAAASLSSSLRDRYPDILWTDIVAMRNVLVHEYFGVRAIAESNVRFEALSGTARPTMALHTQA